MHENFGFVRMSVTFVWNACVSHAMLRAEWSDII